MGAKRLPIRRRSRDSLHVLSGGADVRGKANAFAAGACAALVAAGGGAAAEDAVVVASFENDLFVFQEDNYTTGLQLAYVSGRNGAPDWARAAARAAGFGGPGADLRWGLGAGQLQFNPEDTETTAPLPDQHPYAAWLYLTASLLAEAARQGPAARTASLTTLQVNLGVVGPSALGEEAQNFAHSVFGIDRVNGWDNQLRDEPGLQVLFERRGRYVTPAGGWEAGFEPHAAFSLGNVLTYAAAGATVRFGRDLRSDYGPPRLRPGYSGSPFFTRRRDANVYLFAGFEGRAVLRNVFLDGNTFRDSLSVDRKPLTGDLHGGVAVQLGRAQATLSYVYRLREFETQETADPFGSVSLQWAL